MTWQLLPGSRLVDHATAWDALQRRTTDTAFLESAFLLPALREFGSGKELLALHGSGELDAAILVRPAGRGMWETFQPSQLPLGPWLAATADPVEPRMRSLMSALPGLALGLGATQLDPRLTLRPADTSTTLRVQDYIDTSYIELSGDFDSYWEARGKNLRQNSRKQRQKLLAEGIEPVLECVRTPELVADALAEYGALETAGWKAGGGTAIHAHNAQGRFYQAMLENFCALARGRIYRYRFGKKVVAMDLCIDNGPTVVILKTAYDESYRTVSPSTLMRQDQFRDWWNEGRYRRIEFYGKTMEWHRRWTEQERRLFHATAYRWPLMRSMHERLIASRSNRASPEPAPVASGA